jgi:hypothetical protein
MNQRISRTIRQQIRRRTVALLIFWISLLPTARVYAQELTEARSQYYFAFGPGFFSNMNSNAIATVLSPGVMWSLDPQFNLAVMTDIGFSLHHNDTRFISPQLKGRYIFAPDYGYYAGLGLGYGYAHTHDSPSHPDDSASGFASSLAVGWKAYSNSTVQLSVELEHQFIWSNSNYGAPRMTFLKVGVHFF